METVNSEETPGGKGIKAHLPKKLLSPVVLLGIAAVGIRLFLTADRDMQALNAPYDQLWFVDSAFRIVWGGGYNHMSFAHLPVYSIWLSFLYLFGLPARVAIDMAWVSAVLYLGFALRRLTGRLWVAIAIFTLLVFHPYCFLIFDQVLAETLLTVLSTAALGGFIELWNCRQRQWDRRRLVALLVSSIGFAAAYHSRKEGIVLLMPFLALMLLSLMRYKDWWSREGRLSLVYPLLISPLLVTLAFGLILSGVNYFVWGIFARYELAAPGYQRAMRALNSINAGDTPKYVLITRKTRALAYAASPTFNELSPFFEGEPGKTVSDYNAQYTGASNEIGSGWFYWVFREFAARAGWHETPRMAEMKYNSLADELEKAFQNGRLPKRKVFSPFIAPDWRKWISEVPRSFVRIGQLIFDATLLPLDSQYDENASPEQLSRYAKVLGRRNIPLGVNLAGWVIVPEGTLIGFGNSEKTYAWVKLTDLNRPDVPNAYAFKLNSAIYEYPSELHVLLKDGTMGCVALSSLQNGFVYSIQGIADAKLGVDDFSKGKEKLRLEKFLSYFASSDVRAELYKPFAALWTVFGYLLASTGILLILSFAIRKSPKQASLVFIITLMLIAVGGRVGLLSILDATSWNGMQIRYILPALPWFMVSGLLGLHGFALTSRTKNGDIK